MQPKGGDIGSWPLGRFKDVYSDLLEVDLVVSAENMPRALRFTKMTGKKQGQLLRVPPEQLPRLLSAIKNGERLTSELLGELRL